MRSIRFRLHFVAFLTIACSAIFGWRGYELFLRCGELQAKAIESLEVKALVMSVFYQKEQAVSQTSPEALGRLVNWRKSLDPQHRREAVNELVTKIAAREGGAVRNRATNVLDIETRAFADFNRRSEQTWKELQTAAGLSLGSALLGVLVLLWTLRRRVFRPLDRLSRRMMDFLVDRYSFQFSQPEGNELGDLQRTFNSLAQRVINTMDELKTLDQAKSEFLNIASHELRTPLTSIKGSLSLLDSGVMGHVDPSCMRLIKIAEVETDRLIRLINDLLDLAKIEAGKLPLASSWLVWDDLISKTTESLSGLAHKADVKIKVEPSVGLEVFMDRDRIQQVLTNLISNAIKFSSQGGWIHVTAGRTPSGELLINVRDQGPGIAETDRSLIFQKFRQGASAENPLVKGTGLGLAIAKALVAEHGGDIGVESEIGVGSVFWFTLPKWRDDESSSDESSAADRNGQASAA